MSLVPTEEDKRKGAVKDLIVVSCRKIEILFCRPVAFSNITPTTLPLKVRSLRQEFTLSPVSMLLHLTRVNIEQLLKIVNIL